MAKGPAGYGLPLLCLLTYVVVSRTFRDRLNAESPLDVRYWRFRALSRLELTSGFLILLAVAMPWFVAMYVRHGQPFTDRLIFHDMFNRAFHHVHDTNEGDDTSFRFYVWQLGYALFPWTGLAPLGLLWWLRSGSTEADRGRSDAGVLLCLWFVFSFALFSFMGTKFHHYIFPAVPPVAMLIGLVLDDMLGDRPLAQRGTLALYLLGLLGGVTLLVVGVAWTQPGSFMGFKRPESPLAPGAPVLGAALFAGGAALIGAVAFLLRPLDESTVRRPDDAAGAHASRMLAGGSVAAGLLLVVVARDLIFRGESADQPGAIRLLQLFTYNYRRPWPESLDFSAALVGFSAIAILACSCLAVRAVRRHAVAALCVLGFVWGVWGLDVYMQRTAQHWGQHEVIEAYYADRKSPDEVLVAYQMNWKGENFYTGNHVPAFVSTGAPFTTWLKKQRDAGVKVLYFITEHGRIGGLKNEVAAKSYREVTDKTLCNKFVLVRAQL
jgi:4-amino-4-deoxy-L-arabinose transferase-like glycosyltransferase